MTSSICSYYTATNSQYENLGFDFFKPSKSSKTPTILQVLPALESGGVERGTLEISEAIMASSWRSLVISKGGRLVEALERQGAKHFEINIGSKNPFAWPKSFKKLKRVISEYNVDVVHARSRMPAWICKYGAQQCGVPFITTFHGRYRDTNALKRIYNSIMVRGECVIAISKFLANDIQSRYGVSDDALKVIPRGADISLFNREIVSEETTNRLIKNWGVPDNTPVIMLPARLTRWKGHGLLINALSLIKDMPFFCILVGEYDTKTSYKSELEALIKRRGLENRVKITGHCEDMASAYKISEVVVSASLDPEPFGRIAVEAQAMEKPIIASNIGGSNETIINEKTGFLFEAGDANSLSKKIIQAITMDESSLKLMGKEGRKNVIKKFNVEKMCFSTYSEYKRLVN